MFIYALSDDTGEELVLLTKQPAVTGVKFTAIRRRTQNKHIAAQSDDDRDFITDSCSYWCCQSFHVNCESVVVTIFNALVSSTNKVAASGTRLVYNPLVIK